MKCEALMKLDFMQKLGMVYAIREEYAGESGVEALNMNYLNFIFGHCVMAFWAKVGA